MMKPRRSLFASLLVTGIVFALIAGCSGGNPNVSAAQDALDAGNPDGALSSIETALEQDSANVEAYQLKAQILRQMADTTMSPDEYKELYRRARQAEEKAIQFDPSVESNLQGSRELAYFQQIQSGAKAFQRGQKRNDSTSFRQAAAFFGAAGAVYPDSADAHLNEAYSRIRMGQREEVIPVFETYVETADSVDANAYTLLGRLYLGNGQIDEAVSLLEEGSSEYPESDDIQSLLLNAYQQSGDTDKAMASYREQVQRSPENSTYRYNYGSLLLQRDQFDKAIKQLKKAVELDPSKANAQYNLGAAYVNKAAAANDSISTIRDQIREEGRQQPNEEEARKLKELTQVRQTSFNNAIPPLEQARQISGEGGQYYADACQALFQAYVNTEQTDKASEVEECAGMDEGAAEEQQQEQQGGGGAR